MSTLAIFALGAATMLQHVTTPYASTGRIALRSVRLSSSTPQTYDVLTADVDLSATYDNPFDPDDVSLDATVTTPKGRRYQMPGYITRSYTRKLENGKEILTSAAGATWRVRLCPTEAGSYHVNFTLRDRNGSAESSVDFRASASQNAGFVRVSRRDKRYFELDSGAPYFPIGANVCWAGNGGTFEYDEWLKAYAAVGCNYARLWLDPSWSTFGIERPGKPDQGLGPWQFDLGNAWRLDRVVEQASRLGMRLMLTIDSFSSLRDHDEYSDWDSNPWNVANGGPLHAPTDFWTHPAVARGYANKLRYLVARYGAYPEVMSWELWNEVDGTTGFDATTAAAWHRIAAKSLKSLDPYGHLVTTSCASTQGLRALDGLDEIDFVQTHHYGSPDIAATIANEQVRKSEFAKPQIVAEVGADSTGTGLDSDAEGMQLHDPMWASIATGGAGSAMCWWWDNLIAPKNLYPLLGGAVRFTSGIDWPSENFRQIWPKATFQTAPTSPVRSDVVVENGPISWSPSVANRATTVRISPQGVSGGNSVSGIQHGIENHPDCHNPLTVRLITPVDTRFDVEVGDVSGFGGARLHVTLDGRTVIDKTFVDGTANRQHKSVTRFAGDYGFDVSRGAHTIVVENDGPDWFMAGYRVKDLAIQSFPKLVSWGLVGNDLALAWCRVADRTWRRVCVTKARVAPAEASTITMNGLAAGRWDAQVWDTWKGEIAIRSSVVVGLDGNARVRLPKMDRDFAIKLVKVP